MKKQEIDAEALKRMAIEQFETQGCQLEVTALDGFSDMFEVLNKARMDHLDSLKAALAEPAPELSPELRHKFLGDGHE